MVVHDAREQEELITEYRNKIDEAYDKFRANIEEIYDYGISEQRMKEEFVRECVNRLGLKQSENGA